MAPTSPPSLMITSQPVHHFRWISCQIFAKLHDIDSCASYNVIMPLYAKKPLYLISSLNFDVLHSFLDLQARAG